MKVLTIIGTRPEIIRLSSTIKLLDKFVNHILVHTGQNYDYELNEIFFQDLDLRKPDHFMGIDTSSLGSAVGDIIRKSEEILKKEKPDALLVLGDTNSCLSAYMAKRMHIPIFHMEAGNRSFDFNVPEEINRRIIDHIADFNLVYTEHARRHLLSEGLPHRRIYLTGSPMYEVLQDNMEKVKSSKILETLSSDLRRSAASASSAFHPLRPKEYFVVSIHREENVDNENNLKQILSTLNAIANKYKYPLIVSTHPRTRKRIDALFGSSIIDHRSSLLFHKPFAFTDYIHLQMNALSTLSDSGTISEESAILGFPAISLRQSMERPEAQDAGTIILTGFETEVVLNAVATVINEYQNKDKRHLPAGLSATGSQAGKYKDKSAPNEYFIENTSWRVLKLIMGNARLNNRWWGIDI